METKSERPNDADIVTRYTNDPKKVSRDRGELKYNVFIDNRTPGKLSIFKITELITGKKSDEIWKIADDNIYKEEQRKVIARADLIVEKVRKLALYLDIEIDNNPLGHGLIESSVNVDQRDIQKEIAISLLSISSHHFK